MIYDVLAVLAAVCAVLAVTIRIADKRQKLVCYFFGHKLVKFLPGLTTPSRIRICDRCYMHHHEEN